MTGLVGWWKLDGGTSGNIANNTTAGLTDASGQGHNGTAKNVNGTGMAWAQGKFKGDVSFDGVDDYVTLGTTATAINTPNVTVSIWINPLFNGNWETIFQNKRPYNNYRGYELSFWGSGELMFSIGDGVNYFETAKTPITQSQWSFIVATYDGATMKLYVNGVLKKTFASATGISYVGGSRPAAFIGADSGGSNMFHGMIDDVRIYNRALSATDVTELYNNGGPTRLGGGVFRNAVIR